MKQVPNSMLIHIWATLKRYGLDFLLIFSLLVYLYFQSTINILELKKMNTGLRYLVNQDKKINALLINHLLGDEDNFDDTAMAMDEMELFMDEFHDNLSSASQLSIDNKWQRLNKELQSRNLLIEDYKTAITLLKNSQEYFPKLVKQYRTEIYQAQRAAQVTTQYSEKVIKVMDELLLGIARILNTKNIKLHGISLNRQLDDFARLDLQESNAELSPNHLIYLHGKLIIEKRHEVENLLDEILSNRIGRLLDALSFSFVRKFEKQKQAVDNYRKALFAVAILLPFMIFFILYQLLKKEKALTSSIKNLNFRIYAQDQHDILSITDENGIIIEVNEKFEQISQYSRDELIGQSHQIIKSGYHDKAFYKEMWQTIAAGKVWQGITKNRNKSGQYYWVNSTIVPFLNEQGKPFRYMAIRTDISEQIINRERLADSHSFLLGLTNALGEGVYALDQQHRCTYINRAAEEILGWNADEVLGQTYQEMIHHKKTQDGLFFEVSDSLPYLSLNDGQLHRSESTVFRCKNGNLIPVAVSATAIVENNRVNGVVVVFNNIFHRVELQRNLVLAKERAEQANQMKSDFISNMSHELRTPLNAVIGLNHILQQTKLNLEQKDYLKKMENSAHLLLGIINDVLDLSKIEAGKLNIEQIEIDLEKELSSLYSVVYEQAQEKKLQFYFSLAPNLPRIIISDPLRLKQILLNLSFNAIKFTHQGSIQINIEQQDNQNNEQIDLLFEVRDSGIGVSESQQQKIFDAFNQADASTSRKYGGTGLGLNISKSLVNKLGGQIAIRPLKDGSCFYFNILAGYQKQDQCAVLNGLSIAHALVKMSDKQTYSQNYKKIFDCWNIDTIENDENFFSQVEKLSSEKEKLQLLLICFEEDLFRKDFSKQLITLSKQNKNILLLIIAHNEQKLPTHDFPKNRWLSLTEPVFPWQLLDGIEHLIQLSQGKWDKKQQQAIDDAKVPYLSGKVLLVEDNMVNQLVVKKILARYQGVEVSLANNGKEGVEKVSEDSFDLVLMDVQMPEMDGLQATREIRAMGSYNNLPIIALTAHALDDEKLKCLDAGMNDHLTKPIIIEKLDEVMQRWLG